jgi:hypothetical protein
MRKTRRRSNDVQELSLLPNLLNGNLRKWAEIMIEDGICLTDTIFNHGLITVVHLGKHLKADGTALEGDEIEFLTGYNTLIGMGEHLKSSMSSLELMSELVQVVEANGGTADASRFCERNRVRVASAAEILRSLANVQGVMVSINSDWWDWDGEEPPQSRYKVRIVKCHSKDQGREQLIITWEIGTIAGIMQQGYAPSEKADLSKVSVRGGKALTNSQYSFQLEPYENGAPAPTLLQPEVPVVDASPFLLTDPDFSKMDVVKAYAHTFVAPAIDYWIKTIDIKKGDEVARFKAVRIFNPLHVVVNKISVADIDNLNLFKLSDHPQIGPHIEGMKSEINKYHAIVQSIKSLDERKDAKVTFLLCCERR